MTRERAIVVGADRPFGAEIVTALRERAYDVSSFAQPVDALADNADAAADVVVFNAPATGAVVVFDAISDAAFERALDDQLFDLVAISQHLLPRLRIRGRIIVVGSRGHLGAWGGAHLMAASAAMAGMVRSMALELAADGIAVNHVAAGFAGSSWDTPEARRHVANTVCLLAEPDTGLVGETLIVDGGKSLRMSESRRR